MTKITHNRIINAPASRVWHVISDFHNPHVFHPLLERTEQIGLIEQGIGASRQCNFYDSNSSAVETVTAWEEGQYYTVQTNEQSVFGKTTGSMRVQPIDANRSEITLVTTYTPKLGLFGKILDILIFRMGLKYTLNRVLNGLQHYIETGELVGKGGKPIPVHIQPAGSKS